MIARWAATALSLGGGFFAFSNSNFTAAAEKVTLARAIYWNLVASQTLDAPYIANLRSLGVSEVHIFLNEPTPLPDDIARGCPMFTYTNSDVAAKPTRWTTEHLRTFANDLKAKGFKVIFTLSPHLRTEAYITDLSQPDKPFGLARSIGGIDIELDVEDQWREDEPPKFCGPANWKDMPKRLVAEVHDAKTPAAHRNPLTLIITTNSAFHHPVFLKLANVVAPQLYGKFFGLSAPDVAKDLKGKWSRFGSVIQPAVTTYCPAGTGDDVCSPEIFEASMKEVATFAKCNKSGKAIRSYVIWSQRTLDKDSTFGKDYLMDKSKMSVEVNCPRP